MTRTTFAFDACFVWKLLAPLSDELNGIFHRISTATIVAIEHVFNVANSYLTCRYYSETPAFYQNDLAIRNTADVTGGKPV
jgi:hypothetical protein